MSKRLETLLPDIFFVGPYIHPYLGRVARHTQRGTQHQKSQNQHEPPRAVHVVQAQDRKHLGPKRAKLVDVVANGFILLEHGANH